MATSAKTGLSTPQKWVALFAVFVVMLVLAKVFGGGGETTGVDAERACREFVDARLKSPASADYELSATQSGTSWTVTGTVDADNSFGASIRNTVRCEMTDDGTEFTLDDITIS